MAEQNVQYWPFPVLPPDQRNEQYSKEVRFLEEAFASGFRPRKFTDVMLDGEYLAENESGRSGLILYRGRNRWEVSLGERQARIQAFWTDDFVVAAAAVLVWLRGGTAADLLAAIEGHVVRGAVVTDSVAVSGQPTP